MDFIFIMLSDMTWLLPKKCMHALQSQLITKLNTCVFYDFACVIRDGRGGDDGYLSQQVLRHIIGNFKFKKKKTLNFPKVCVCPEPPQPHTYLLTLSRSPHAMSLCTSYKNCIDYLTFVDLVYLYPYFAVYRNFHGTLPCN